VPSNHDGKPPVDDLPWEFGGAINLEVVMRLAGWVRGEKLANDQSHCPFRISSSAKFPREVIQYFREYRE
jgi:uncharacterized Fe-S cluster-containing radical SAM superfamily enzyme